MTKVKAGFLFLFLIFFKAASADQEEDKIIENLRELAARLGWSQDIFIGFQTEDKDVKIFGIADIPFSKLHSASEKSYLQWVFGHRLPLERILDRHLKNNRRLGFEVVPMEGIGDKAYRALRYSYTLKDFNTLELSQSQEIVEILFFKNLLTLRDERPKRDADAWSIFEEVFERTKIDPFIQPMPSQLPQKLDLEARFRHFPKKIRLSRIFPMKGEGGSEWHIHPFTLKEKRNQIASSGRRYRLLKDGGSSLEIEVSLFAYASPALAQSSFKQYLRKIKGSFSIQDEEKDRSAFLISKKELNANRYVFCQEIFIFDLKITAKQQKNASVLLKSFSVRLRDKTNKIFQKD